MARQGVLLLVVLLLLLHTIPHLVDGEMRILAPQQLKDAHGDKPVATGRFLYYGHSKEITGTVVVIDGKEVCPKAHGSVESLARFRDLVHGKIVLTERYSIRCSLIGSSYPFMAGSGAIAFVPVSNWPVSGFIAFRHHEWNRDKYRGKSLMMPDVTKVDILKAAVGCDGNYKPLHRREDRSSSQCIYGNNPFSNEIADVWASIEEEIVVTIGPPYEDLYIDFFTSWYFTILFRVVTSALAFWVSCIAVVTFLNYSRRDRNGQRDAASPDAAKSQYWTVGRTVCILEAPLCALLGVLSAGGQTGPQFFPEYIHLSCIGKFQILSNVTSFILALHMREIVNALERRDKRPNNILNENRLLITSFLFFALFADMVFPQLYFLWNKDSQMATFFVIVFSIAVVSYFATGTFFWVSAYRLSDPLLRQFRHPDSHLHKYRTVLLKKVVICLLASGLCMLLSTICNAILAVRSYQQNVGRSLYTFVWLSNFGRLGCSYFHIQSLIPPDGSKQGHWCTMIFAVPRLEAFRQNAQIASEIDTREVAMRTELDSEMFQEVQVVVHLPRSAKKKARRHKSKSSVSKSSKSSLPSIDEAAEGATDSEEDREGLEAAPVGLNISRGSRELNIDTRSKPPDDHHRSSDEESKTSDFSEPMPGTPSSLTAGSGSRGSGS